MHDTVRDVYTLGLKSLIIEMNLVINSSNGCSLDNDDQAASLTTL